MPRVLFDVQWLRGKRTSPPKKRKKKKGTLKMVTVKLLVLRSHDFFDLRVFGNVSRYDSDAVDSCFQSAAHGSARVKPWTHKLSDCSFLSNNFVMISVCACVGWLRLQPADKQIIVLTFLALMHLYFHMLIFHCAYFIQLFFHSRQV